MEYSRGQEKVWVYGALRVRDGQKRTRTAPSRDTGGYLRLLGAMERANPTGDLYVIMHNLSSHTSGPIQVWLTDHPRVQQVPIPTGACWLNIDQATCLATQQRNCRAQPWVWGRPPPRHRHLRRHGMYSL